MNEDLLYSIKSSYTGMQKELLKNWFSISDMKKLDCNIVKNFLIKSVFRFWVFQQIRCLQFLLQTILELQS